MLSFNKLTVPTGRHRNAIAQWEIEGQRDANGFRQVYGTISLWPGEAVTVVFSASVSMATPELDEIIEAMDEIKLQARQKRIGSQVDKDLADYSLVGPGFVVPQL